MADHPDVVVKPMFGNLGAYVNGNMFMGLFGGDLGLKLADADRAELIELGGGPFGPEERPMGGYTTVPWTWADDAATTEAWVDRAHAHVAGFAPKIAKPKRTKPAP